MQLQLLLVVLLGAISCCEALIRTKQISSPRRVTLLKLRAGSNLLEAYNAKLEANPWTTKIVTSGIISAIGDLVVQLINIKRESAMFDIRRFIIFTCMGGFYIAPIITWWMTWVDSLPYPAALSNTRTKKSLSMLFLDQTLGSVVVNVGFLAVLEMVQKSQ
jgi:hypothetical protein